MVLSKRQKAIYGSVPLVCTLNKKSYSSESQCFLLSPRQNKLLIWNRLTVNCLGTLGQPWIMGIEEKLHGEKSNNNHSWMA